jgi:hypothetical protein
MRGRGWLSSYPLGNPIPAAGLPLVNGSRWDTGVQIHGVNGPIEWIGAVTTGSLSNPRVDDDNDARQIAGRAIYRPAPAIALGISAARGAFISRDVQAALTDGARVEDAVQRAVGVDAEYSAGRLISRGEVIWSRWTLPAPFVAGPVEAASVLAEARYRLIPGVHVAARAEHLGFSKLSVDALHQAWDAPVSRYELGMGWAVQRNVMLKASWQRNLRDGGRVRHDSFGAAQLVYWF